MSDSQPLSTAILPPTHSHAGFAARPKVMRRPAQLTPPSLLEQDASPLPANTTAVEAAPASPSTRPWQEDGTFAAALLSVAIIINLLLSVALPATRQPMAAAVVSHPTPVVHILDETADTESDQ